MKRDEAKQINNGILKAGIISKDIYRFIESEIDALLEEELQEEKSKVKNKISAIFEDNYLQASTFFKESLQFSY